MVSFLRDLNGNQMFPNEWGRPTGLNGSFEQLPKLSSKPEHRIITLEEFYSNPFCIGCDHRLIEYIHESPDRLYTLEPRQFEEFVAEMLDKLGYQVQLTGKGADNGVDIFANRQTDAGPELVLVQCKRHAKEKKISKPTLKQLHADVRDQKATKGLFVTSSSFTRPAKIYIEDFRYRLAGADFDNIQEWLARITSTH